ncbi:MAG: FMN-binding protein [Flavobacteriales bacterium]
MNLGNEIDGITGATISARSITKSIKTTTRKLKKILKNDIEG